MERRSMEEKSNLQKTDLKSEGGQQGHDLTVEVVAGLGPDGGELGQGQGANQGHSQNQDQEARAGVRADLKVDQRVNLGQDQRVQIRNQQNQGQGPNPHHQKMIKMMNDDCECMILCQGLCQCVKFCCHIMYIFHKSSEIPIRQS